MGLDPAWIALIGTLCGTLGMKIVEHILGRSKVKLDEAGKMREGYRQDISDQKQEIKDLEEEVDKWKEQYYDLRDQFSEAKLEYAAQIQELKNRLDEVQKTIDAKTIV